LEVDSLELISASNFLEAWVGVGSDADWVNGERLQEVLGLVTSRAIGLAEHQPFYLN